MDGAILTVTADGVVEAMVVVVCAVEVVRAEVY